MNNERRCIAYAVSNSEQIRRICVSVGKIHQYGNHKKTRRRLSNYAVSLDMLSTNPCRNANLPSVKKVTREIYTLQEAQLFLDRLTEKAPLVYQCYFILMIYSSFRRGEMCGLTWDNVDFENHTITVEKALSHITNLGDILETPKTVN